MAMTARPWAVLALVPALLNGGMARAAPSSPTPAQLQQVQAHQAQQESEAAAARARVSAIAAMQAALSQQRIETAAKLRQVEEATAAAADRMAGLAAQKKAVSAALLARAAAFAPLLPLIERLALFPSETLLAVPAAPRDTLRGACHAAVQKSRHQSEHRPRSRGHRHGERA
jgi:septal ring factor EnvC (AmiA/AmiB activator)